MRTSTPSSRAFRERPQRSCLPSALRVAHERNSGSDSAPLRLPGRSWHVPSPKCRYVALDKAAQPAFWDTRARESGTRVLGRRCRAFCAARAGGISRQNGDLWRANAANRECSALGLRRHRWRWAHSFSPIFRATPVGLREWVAAQLLRECRLWIGFELVHDRVEPIEKRVGLLLKGGGPCSASTSVAAPRKISIKPANPCLDLVTRAARALGR